MKNMYIALTAMMAVLLFASAASAHVTVRPKEVKQGSYEVFTVRVPSETKGTNTVKVEVKIPEGVNISRVEPKPGWKYELERGADERIAGVTWSADSAGLAETEFTEFRIQGKVANDASELVWKAYQTYADGSVAEWVGDVASVTAVLAGTGESDGHGHDSGGAGETAGDAADAKTAGDTTAAEPASGAAHPKAAGSGNPLTLSVSVTALVLSVIALILAFRRTRK